MADSVADLEREHKTQLANLVNSWLLWHKTWADNEKDHPTDYETKKANLTDYYKTLYRLTYNWLFKQFQYEHDGGVTISHLTYTMPPDLITPWMITFHPQDAIALYKKSVNDYLISVLRAIQNPTTFKNNFLPLAKSYINAADFNPAVSGKGETMGIIPLLIWAVIAIAAYFTVSKISEDIDSSRKDQTELITATSKLCKDNNLTAEQCQALVTQQTTAITEENKSGGLGWVGWIALIFGGLYVVKNPQIFQSSPKTKAA